MPDYLLDTNILSALARDPHGVITGHIERVGESSVCTSIIVVCELRFGIAKNRAPSLVKNVEAILARLEIRELGRGVDFRYGELRASLERKGRPIGANDLLIAAHALAEDLTLVTGNAREFRRIAGLRVENWLD